LEGPFGFKEENLEERQKRVLWEMGKGREGEIRKRRRK